jgi:hypothetical protein
MKCQRISTKGGLGYALHLLICKDCRNHRATDRAISAGLSGLRTTNYTGEGLDATLLAVERAERTGRAAMPFSHDILHRKANLKKLLPTPRMQVLLVMGLGLTGLGIMNYLEAMPAVNIPSPTLPNPNGFDALVLASEQHKNTREVQRKQAQKELMDKEKQERVRAKNLSEKQTGKRSKPEAGGRMGTSNTTSDLVSEALMPEWQAKDMKMRVYTLAEQEKVLAPYKSSLDMLRSSLKLPYWNPPSRSFSTQLPHLAQFQSMARTLSLEARVHEEKQEWGKAMESRLDILEMGSNLPKGGILLADRVGIALKSIGTQNIGDVISHLSFEEAASALTRLERISQNSFTLPQVLQEEMWGTQGAMLEIFKKNGWGWRREFLRLISLSYEQKPSALQNSLGALSTMLISKRAIMKNLTRYYEAQIQRTAQPYAMHLPEPPKPADMLSKMLFPLIDNAYFIHTYSQVANTDMLKIRLALRAYFLKKGTYPATLQELVSTHYLQTLPTDSFAKDGKFRYRKQGKNYLLYSVGPDGVDDSGKPIEIKRTDPKRPKPKNRYVVDSTGKGDIVVGMNVK